MGLVPLKEEEKRERSSALCADTEERSCVDIARRHLL